MNLFSPVAEKSVVSFSRRGMTFTKNKSASTATRVVAYFCSVSPLADVVFTNVECDHRELFSLLAQVTTEMWVIFPTSHDTELTPRRRRQMVYHACGTVVPRSLVSPVL